jgi:hypothetical protein
VPAEKRVGDVMMDVDEKNVTEEVRIKKRRFANPGPTKVR